MGAPTSDNLPLADFWSVRNPQGASLLSNVSMAPQQEPRVIDGARDAGVGSGQGCVLFVVPFYCEP